MTTTVPAGLVELKAQTRRTWASGDFPAIARRELWGVGEHIVQRVGVGVGERVLDVACGTGNAAIRAAQAGGRVTGVDLTPELFDAARREADAAGVTVDWVEGDAEDLPFADASFDVVLSTFGVMFAPRHEVAAAELARVLRPGGRLGICSWTPDGQTGEMFRLLGGFAPPPPPFVQPPLLWGEEEHVREVFARTGMHLEFERAVAQPTRRFESGYASFDFGAENFGPMIALRPVLERRGEWAELRERAVAILDRDVPAAYLVALGRKAD